LIHLCSSGTSRPRETWGQNLQMQLCRVPALAERRGLWSWSRGRAWQRAGWNAELAAHRIVDEHAAVIATSCYQHIVSAQEHCRRRRMSEMTLGRARAIALVRNFTSAIRRRRPP